MTLTPKHAEIISERPLINTLDSFRNRFREASEADPLQQEDVAGLLGALVASPAAFSLPSPDGGGSVAIKLLSILQHVRGDTVNLDKFQRLVQNVAEKSPDQTI